MHSSEKGKQKCDRAMLSLGGQGQCSSPSILRNLGGKQRATWPATDLSPWPSHFHLNASRCKERLQGAGWQPWDPAPGCR